MVMAMAMVGSMAIKDAGHAPLGSAHAIHKEKIAVRKRLDVAPGIPTPWQLQFSNLHLVSFKDFPSATPQRCRETQLEKLR